MTAIKKFYDDFRNVINIISVIVGLCTVATPVAYTLLNRIDKLEKSNETMSYVIREECDAERKGTHEGVQYTLWKTDTGTMYYYCEPDGCFYKASYSPVTNSWGYNDLNGDYHQCGI